VRAAGGFTGRAQKGHLRVTVARTGQQMKPGDAGAINAGDTVWVPAKPERSRWAILRDVLTTAAQVATVYLVIYQATRWVAPPRMSWRSSGAAGASSR
jgi:hypothetical protein